MYKNKVSVGDTLLWSGAGMIWVGIWYIHPPSAMIFIGAFCITLGLLQLRVEK